MSNSHPSPNALKTLPPLEFQETLSEFILEQTEDILEQVIEIQEEWQEETALQSTDWSKKGKSNATMFQWFHWYIPCDGNHWNRLKEEAANLANAGITSVWIPPAYKGKDGGYEVGYAVYDLFDLGEFPQKGSIATKYGTKDQLVAAVKEAKAQGLQIYADAVFNHKIGADRPEELEAIPLDFEDRTKVIGEKTKVQVWTHFTFPGRGGKYSNMEWHWWHFDATDHDFNGFEHHRLHLFDGKQFDPHVALEKGNFDYLFGCDLDMEHEEVKQELKYWGEWMIQTLGVDGFRLDALKHISVDFIAEWVEHIRHYGEENLFMVGEYWKGEFEPLREYIMHLKGKICLFDVPLHYNFFDASKMGNAYDMQRIFDDTLMRYFPNCAVTFVENHDSQPLQALESVVEPWFKPLAYAIILLREEGYPCVFYADYYGATYQDKGQDGNEYEINMPSHQWIIDHLLFARKHYAYGKQHDYFDHYSTVGWTRLGNKDHPQAMAVLMSNGDAGYKWMNVGKPHTTFYDLTEHIQETVTTNEHGFAEFYCLGGSVSVWVEKQINEE